MRIIAVYLTLGQRSRVRATYDPWPTTGEPIRAVECDGCGRIDTSPSDDTRAEAAALHHAAICIC